jgi:hypothetical protein
MIFVISGNMAITHGLMASQSTCNASSFINIVVFFPSFYDDVPTFTDTSSPSSCFHPGFVSSQIFFFLNIRFSDILFNGLNKYRSLCYRETNKFNMLKTKINYFSILQTSAFFII